MYTNIYQHQNVYQYINYEPKPWEGHGMLGRMLRREQESFLMSELVSQGQLASSLICEITEFVHVISEAPSSLNHL